MNDLLKQHINEILRQRFGTEHAFFRTENITIESDDFQVKLDENDFAFMLNKTIDVPITAKVEIFSSQNYLTFSREEFEKNDYSFECFEDYLRVKTRNYGNSFVPFTINILIVTPK